MIKNCKISPYNILAVTFTNKASKEMKERVIDLIGEDANRALISTFHSFGLRLLRVYGNKLGYGANFTIYDTDDQKRVVKNIYKALGITQKNLTEGVLISIISKLKEENTSPEEFISGANAFGENDKLIGEVYLRYNRILKENNAMDFSDILLNTCKILQNAEILAKVQDKFRYIMVDEYQDTNKIQYEIINMIAKKYQNICVVGDENQSIYGFRGANIQNILDFERDYKDAKVVKLEENYRSTSVILDAANSVIKNNSTSKDKILWTKKKSGEQISLLVSNDGREEVNLILEEVLMGKAQGQKYRDFTVLYRTNAQSRLFEEGCLRNNIPYKVFGGMQFYQRAEIKDLLAYLSVVNNNQDNINLARIINVPKRKIGDKTIEKITEYRNDNGISLFEAISECDKIDEISQGVKDKLKEFTNILKELMEMSESMTVSQIFDRLIALIGYNEYVKNNYDDFEGRLENIDELYNSIIELERVIETLTLRDYLENVSLVSATDDLNTEIDYLKLMTIHNSKGLEFPVVFISGMEDEVFPSKKASFSNSELEEERRLCYVAITRAEDKLYISYANSRYVYGELNYRTRSRFIDEIPNELIKANTDGSDSRDIYRRDRNISNTDVDKNQMGVVFRKTITMEDLNKTMEDAPYKIGDKVMHNKFGIGVVRSLTLKKVEIDFVEGRKEIALAVADKFLTII
jgi:DNA helicase-2/ATP-dependent DNA helicase PcrA